MSLHNIVGRAKEIEYQEMCSIGQNFLYCLEYISFNTKVQEFHFFGSGPGGPG